MTGQVRAEPPPRVRELLGQVPRERREGARTNVVFNALGIAFGDFRGNAQCLQKSDDDFVPLLANFS